MEDYKNLRCFEVSYIGPSQTKGGRVKIHDLRHNIKRIIDFDYEFNNIADIAQKFLKGFGINCPYRCESVKGYLLLSDNFAIQIK